MTDAELRQVLATAPAVRPYVETGRYSCVACVAQWLMDSARYLGLGDADRA